MLELGEFFIMAKDYVIKQGYEWEIEVCEKRRFADMDEKHFIGEYIFVVLSAGMKNQVVQSMMEKFKINGVASVGHLGKRKAISKMFDIENGNYNYITCFKKLQSLNSDLEKLEYLQTLNWVGIITKYHLARNLGIDCAKPDRHLIRLAKMFQIYDKYGNPDVQLLCSQLSIQFNLRIGTVDVILWRFCNLVRDYHEVILDGKRI